MMGVTTGEQHESGYFEEEDTRLTTLRGTKQYSEEEAFYSEELSQNNTPERGKH